MKSLLLLKLSSINNNNSNDEIDLILLKSDFIDNNDSDDKIKLLLLIKSLKSSVILLKPRYNEVNKNSSLDIYNVITIYNLNVCEYD